jgi:hypothetical protein
MAVAVEADGSPGVYVVVELEPGKAIAFLDVCMAEVL